MVAQLHPDFAVLVTDWMTKTIQRIAPEAGHRAAYGGLVFERSPTVHTSMFCGLYEYRAHLTIEFSHGARLDDRFGVLEGVGKFRRHIKLRGTGDILAKNCEGYILQAYALDQPRL